MKKLLFLIITIILTASIFCLDVGLEINTSNYGFTDKGDVAKQIPDFGAKLTFHDRLTKHLDANFKFERIPMFGNVVSARLGFGNEYINFSIGPTLGFLNKIQETKEIASLFQPGIGVGFTVSTPSGFYAKIDTEFAIPTVGVSLQNVYLNNGQILLGFRLPHVITFFGVKQIARTINTDSGNNFNKAIDFGIYMEVFSKPSRFKFPLNAVFRIMNFQNSTTPDNEIKLGLVILESGMTHAISSDIEWFFNLSTPIYTILLKGEKPKKVFRFSFSVGANFSIKK